MKRNMVRGLCACVLMIAWVLGRSLWAAPQPILWSAKSAGFRVEVTKHNIRAIRIADGRQVFSAQAMAKAALAVEVAADRDPGQKQTVDIDDSFSVQSLTGPYLSLRESVFLSLSTAAHPNITFRYWTIDLRRTAPIGFSPIDSTAVNLNAPGQAVLLTDLFSEKALMQALTHDPFVLKKLAGRKLPGTPKALLDMLAQNANMPADTCLDSPDDELSYFIFWGRAKNGDVLVRLGMPANCPYDQGKDMLKLGMSLAPTAALRASLPPGVTVQRPPKKIKVSVRERAHF